MIDNTTDIRTPEEKHLAYQAGLNAQKAALQASMAPDQAAKMTVIEECVAKLEAAQIPFVGWFATEQHPDGRCDWWQFNRYSYDADFTTMATRTSIARAHQAAFMLEFMTKGMIGCVVTYDKDSKPIAMARDGEVKLWPKEEA